MSDRTAGLVVFDLDGTLIDSATDIAAAASALVVECGGRALTRTEVVAMVGEGAAVLVRRALTAAGLDPATPRATERYLEIYSERMFDHTGLYPGMKAALGALDPLATLAVLTNKAHAPSERLLEALGVRRHFIEVVGGDGRWPRKPDPGGLMALRVHAGGGPVVMVGDSPVDAEVAARAGTAFVLARYGFGAAGFATLPLPAFVAEAAPDLPRVIAAARRAATLRT
ncbi:MAG: HAD-IA family hydrolase [Acidobacteriota bacterium]